MSVHPSQSSFLSCYRGKQGALNHLAYMRMSKVLLLRALLADEGIDLARKEIFDYGFGAGTFFRYCPPDSSLFGVELDPVCVEEVAAMLRERGAGRVQLDTLEIETWDRHTLLRREYDLVVCSHVLEHLEDPVGFLQRMRRCVRSDGRFLALVPVNERRPDPHHVQAMTREVVEGWLDGTGFALARWIESDHWLYWIQPLFTHADGWRHRLAQGISLGLGALGTVAGPRLWFAAGGAFGAVSGSRPTQAAMVLKPVPDRSRIPTENDAAEVEKLNPTTKGET